MDSIYKKIFKRIRSSSSPPNSRNTSSSSTMNPNTEHHDHINTTLQFTFPPTPAASDRGDMSPPSGRSSGTSSAFNVSRKCSISGALDIAEDLSVHKELFPLPPPSVMPKLREDVDEDTPDAHVPRDERLIPLTGAHPFNCEAPLSDLFNSGFLTPPELFYVRNHGAVPKVEDEAIMDWEVTVEGLVSNPLTLSFRDICSAANFPQYTLPITLVCAGNRRKEQNVVRKSQGFSWGPAGLSTSLFTGPMLSDIINLARPDRRRAKYVWFEGADKLPHGSYGTSVKLSWVMDPAKGIMLAYKMNGEMLRPDHGKPIRVVVPGMIGGRSVKWLKKIVVSDTPSTNWYHYYDNRVIPNPITPEFSKTEDGDKFWRDERFAIYDLNVNSAVAYPAHDEVVEVKPKMEELAAEEEESYTVRGYAYGGGGRRITRVEVSLDQGASWRLANIEYPEDAYRHLNVPEDTHLFGGKLDMTWRDSCFCWCFWNIKIAHSELIAPSTSNIVVRAMDESLALQPKEMYWSVLGMMNNPWFRVIIHKETREDGSVKLKFQHPAPAEIKKLGWMEQVKKEGGNIMDGNWGQKKAGVLDLVGGETTQEVKPAIVMTSPDVNRVIEFEELKDHAPKGKGSWFVVEGEVYDGTPFLNEHPGGAPSITAVGGLDCTEEFQAIHSETAKLMMKKYHIGTLSPQAKAALVAEANADTTEVSAAPRPIFLNAKSWLPSRLLTKTAISHDTILLRFGLEHAQQRLGLPIGQHILIKTTPKGGKVTIRAYTPISQQTPGEVTLLVKVYRDEGVEGKRGGVMSQALDALAVGETIQVKGPTGKFTYLPTNTSYFSSTHNITTASSLETPPPTPTTIQDNMELMNVTFAPSGSKPRRVTKFLMICAGTGITPIYQVLQAAFTEGNDSAVKCFVAYGNRAEDDMLCKDEIERIVDGRRTRVVHALSNPKGDVGEVRAREVRRGRVGLELVQEGVEWLNAGEGERGASGKREEGDMMVLVCGPEGLERAVRGWVEERRGEWGVRGVEDVCFF
ncbi:nitrate reductase [Peziza echinospora]|nr:nitrate reductase [Peziza echinospora]